MFELAFKLIGILILCHFIFDYPLQGDFLAKAKNEKAPIPGVPWVHAMFAHTFMHAGAVTLVTGSWLLGALYDWSIPAMIAVTVGAQVAAIPLYYFSSKTPRKERTPESAA